MKKSLVAAITTALAVGTASTTFAAANPFSDLPADHWAYDAVTQLAADGVVEGYGDTTFRGDRNITRYEMAQMIAKLMAKTDWGASDRALLDKLAAEFSEELNNLGVRVANLERNADMVKWNGVLEYTYTSDRHEYGSRTKTKTNDDNLKFRLEPSAEVNDHWHVNARLDADINMAKDNGQDDGDGSRVSLVRAWAQGDYDNFQVKFGKMELFPRNQDGLLLDDEFSGAEVTFGKVVKVTLQAGRLDLTDADAFGIANGSPFNGDDPANFQSINIGVDHGKLSADIGYMNLNTDNLGSNDVRNYAYTRTGNNNDAHIWYIDALYQFDHNIGINAAYARNTEADYGKYSWFTKVQYKGAEQEHAGTWGIYAAYRRKGVGTSILPTDDLQMEAGQKGWEIAANYVPFKNVVGTLGYFRGKDMLEGLASGDDDADKLFGRVEFFF